MKQLSDINLETEVIVINLKTFVIDALDIYSSKLDKELKTRIRKIFDLQNNVEIIINE